jgi:hypothetical protein
MLRDLHDLRLQPWPTMSTATTGYARDPDPVLLALFAAQRASRSAG